jgi:hypothetical protein
MAVRRKLPMDLIENEIDVEKREQEQFFTLAERFRNEQDPKVGERLGDELGRMIFAG